MVVTHAIEAKATARSEDAQSWRTIGDHAVHQQAQPPEDMTSADLTRQLLTAAPGGQVVAASATVTGAPFHGRVANLQGARVTASPVIRSAGKSVPATAKEHAFIVDFGRPVAVLGLRLDGLATISLVV